MTRDRRPFPFLEAFPPRPNEQPEPFSDMSSAYTFIRPYLDANGAWCAFDWRSADPLARSANEIASTCASTGVHMLTSAFPLLLPVGPEALADETLCATFSPKQAVFLLPEQALSLSDTVQRSTDLRARGYRIGVQLESPELLRTVPFTAFDHLGCTGSTVRQEFTGSDLRYAARIGFRRIATDVRSHDMHDWLHGNGFDWFDGRFLAAPDPRLGRSPDLTRLKLLHLLDIVRHDGDTREIEAIFREEPKLAYNLLRLVNSAAVGARTQITSFTHAITILGRRRLQRWLQLLVYANHLAEGQGPNPLMQLAAARGRQMELLCIALDPKPEILDLCDSAYMTGLFSLLEVLINLPMQDIVKELPLQDEVLEALATPGQGGQLSRVLAALCAGEAGRYQEASERFAELGISPEKLTKAQATAFLWASHIDRISLD